MNRTKLTELINHPEKVTSRDAAMMADMAAQYPYAAILQILLAKSQQQHEQARQYLGTAALYTPNRSVLRLVMENRLPGLAAQAAEAPQPPLQQPQASASQQESSPHISTASGNEQLLDRSPEPETDEHQGPSPDFYNELQENLRRLKANRTKSSSASTGSPEESPTTENAQVPEKAPPISPTVQQIMQEHQEQTLENPRVQQQRSLIDSFLQNGSMLPRRQLQDQPASESPQADLSQPATFTPPDLATETLAAIMERQGKTEKAIDIYQKLLLKYPQKSAYFADCIERLKKIE
ncbi:tetratricopeptide repeat protein [Cesiribacter andamanensis]|uniref:Tetratricopeptide repeat protein n=1 Tax=Cesiribacter andamanensis AMV16 TaxID=1279009 RepID=M7N5C8_9BACT|nr:tetratricopeptide repeat protein [Cesiribacter andamanensis]EMR02431.1 hypothetical protein ADICEAN_02417 [Cesiribacter andamanensis AMV16]